MWNPEREPSRAVPNVGPVVPGTTGGGSGGIWTPASSRRTGSGVAPDSGCGAWRRIGTGAVGGAGFGVWRAIMRR